MEKLGIGIIGCGNISAAYLTLAPVFKGLEVRAVADVNMDAAQARAAEFNTKAQSVDDLLANPAVDPHGKVIPGGSATQRLNA